MKRILLLGAFLLLLSNHVANASLLFFDDFNSGAKPDWGQEIGNWDVNGGTYSATNSFVPGETYSSVTAFPDLVDFIAEMDILNYYDGGIWLRSNRFGGLNNGVLLVAGGLDGTNNGLYWHIVENDIPGPGFIGFVSIPGIQGTNAHIRVEVLGSQYSVFVNGSNVAASTIYTNKFASGKVALYDYLDKTSFDNFSLSTIEPIVTPEPASMLLFGFGGVAMAFRGFREKRNI